MNTIGKQIVKLRSRFSYTQEDLADIIGVSKQTISNWETGLKTPRMGAIQKLSDHFHVSKSFIIEGEEPEVKETDSMNATVAHASKAMLQLDENRQMRVLDFINFQLSEQKRESDSLSQQK